VIEFCKKVGKFVKVDVEFYHTKAKKMAFKDATALLSNFIGNGAIYIGTEDNYLNPDQKRKN
jgi:hypothetical protein